MYADTFGLSRLVLLYLGHCCIIRCVNVVVFINRCILAYFVVSWTRQLPRMFNICLYRSEIANDSSITPSVRGEGFIR
jgi:hypothetical protein